MSGQQVEAVVDLDAEDDDDFAPPPPPKRRVPTKDSAPAPAPESVSTSKTTKSVSAREEALAPAAASARGGPPRPAAPVAVSGVAAAAPVAAGLEARVAVLEKTVVQLRDERAALQKQVDGLLAAKTQQDARLARLEQALAASSGRRKAEAEETTRKLQRVKAEEDPLMPHTDEDEELAALLWMEEQAQAAGPQADVAEVIQIDDEDEPATASNVVEEYHAAASQSSGSEWKKAFEWEEAINLANTEIFHNTAFRTSQREIINATMAGRDCFVLHPTGAGKSLCYQLPAVCEDGTTLVVAPLISLIHDQVTALSDLNIPARYLSSESTKTETKAIIAGEETLSLPQLRKRLA